VLPVQPVGVAFTEPTFGTTLRRVSATSVSREFETPIYSQLQAFSSDDEYLLLTGSNGYVVRRLNDLSLVAGLDTSTWNVPRWHPTRPHVIVHFDANVDADVTVQFTDVDSLVTTDVFTFPPQYRTILGNQSFDEVSDDGRWIAGMVTRSDGGRAMFTLNLESQTVGVLIPLSGLYDSGTCARDPQWGLIEPDWLAPSPLGRYLVVQWPRDGIARCSGLETFDIQTGAFVGRVYDGHQHGDLGVTPDGANEFFMTFELSAPPPDNNRPAIGVRSLPGTNTVSEPQFVRVLDWGNSEHISCRGPAGVCVVTAGTLADNGWNPFEGEIFIQRTDGSVLRIAHHRSSSCGYWVQPRATISRDGRYVAFASDWAIHTGRESCTGGNDLGAGDPYVIDLSSSGPDTGGPGGGGSDDQPPTITELRLLTDARGTFSRSNSSRPITAIRLSFSEPVSEAPAVDLNTYTLVGLGGDNQLGTRDDRILPLRSASLDADSATVTLVPRRSLDTNQLFQLTASRNDALTDRSSNRLDGDTDGQPGGSYRATFGRGTRLTVFDFDGDRVTFTLSGRGTMELGISADVRLQHLRIVDGSRRNTTLAGKLERAVNGDGTINMGIISGLTVLRTTLPKPTFRVDVLSQEQVDSLLSSTELL